MYCNNGEFIEIKNKNQYLSNIIISYFRISLHRISRNN